MKLDEESRRGKNGWRRGWDSTLRQAQQLVQQCTSAIYDAEGAAGVEILDGFERLVLRIDIG
jgi:hypothetical protein